MPVAKIISGGQSGADRAGLDAAIDLGLLHGGWCPAGRRTEDGMIPWQYKLEETSSPGYPERTRLNVRDSNATVVFTCGALTPGSAQTLNFAKTLGRPVLHVDIDMAGALEKFRTWLGYVKPSVLNVAGSRESKAPGISVKVRAMLVEVLRPVLP